MATATLRLHDFPGRRRHVIGWIHREEPRGLQQESDVGRRHHRIVLGPRQMSVPEGVPEDHIGRRDRPIRRGPSHKTVASGTLIWIITRREPLVRMEGRDPDVMIDEPGPPPPPCLRRGERYGVVAREEAVADRLADSVEPLRIDDLPGSR